MPIFFLFAAVFLIFPAMEVLFFMYVAGKLGFLIALALLVLAGVIGMGLLQGQSLKHFRDLQESSRAKGLSLHLTIDAALDDMFDDLCISAAAVLLILPGFLTDVVAVILLIPAARNRLQSLRGPRPVKRRPGDPNVIEGEYERLE
jgi:UPF0716 protein FxsA